MSDSRILIIGANGQLGTELENALTAIHGRKNVIIADIKKPAKAVHENFVLMDVLNRPLLQSVILTKKITEVYMLAAVLSATGEKEPELAWHLNMQGLLNVLEIARLNKLKVFWPSSIAVFGPSSPRQFCPQQTVLEPATVYGISKVAGELWCRYYFEKFGVDVRSIRYPGLISYTAPPGGGTTDYAVDIFHHALDTGSYTCFLKPDTFLPMMYMPDALEATLSLMQAPPEKIKVRTAYNIAGVSFCPAELAAAVTKQINHFTIQYNPDFRQAIADSWPQSIDDTAARNDWGWKPQYDTGSIAVDMLKNIAAIRSFNNNTALKHEVNHT